MNKKTNTGKKMKSFSEELEDLVDKHIKNKKKTSDDHVNITRDCIAHFGNHEKAVFACLISLGNFLKVISEICEENKDENRFSQILSDPVIKMVLPFIYDIMTCKRFK